MRRSDRCEVVGSASVVPQIGKRVIDSVKGSRMLGIAQVTRTFVWCALIGTSLNAQSPPTTSNQSVTSVVPNMTLPAGGGAGADFTELFDLIQQVVPGEWDTGEDTIDSFASGVWIDPQGIMHRPASESPSPRFKPAPSSSQALKDLLGESQQPQELRWVSLSALSSALSTEPKRKALGQPRAIIVGGLSRIDYLHYEHAEHAWYIGGPAGGFELNDQGDLISQQTQLPPILLEDLLTVAPFVLQGRGVFGCTIDPDPQGLVRAQELLNQPGATKRLTKLPEQFSEELGKAMGPQKLTLINMPEGCTTGRALLIADEHMKRVGLELATAPPTLVSYWRAAEERNKIVPNTMVRWWFAMSESPAAQWHRNAEDDLSQDIDYQLDRSSVRVLSQLQWMDQRGERFDIREQDKAADSFAASFTEHFSELQKTYPAYGRLRHVFDLAVVCELIRRECESSSARLPDGLARYDTTGLEREPLATVDTVVSWKNLNGKSIAAVASGGVVIDARSLKTRDADAQESANKAPRWESDKKFHAFTD